MCWSFLSNIYLSYCETTAVWLIVLKAIDEIYFLHKYSRLIVPALFSVVIPFIHENCVGYKDGNLMDAMFVDDKRKSMWIYVEKEVIYRQNGNEWTSTREKLVDMCFIHS